MIRRCKDEEFDLIWTIINDGARAYKGVIPADCLHEPYMSKEDLGREIGEGVAFWACEEQGEVLGVMGIQPVEDVTLIRHAYVRTGSQKQGVGAKLLAHLRLMAHGQVLIGTWRDATWAIRFYEKHGFRLVDEGEKERLLRKYWTVPLRQIATSVVLADSSGSRVS